MKTLNKQDKELVLAIREAKKVVLSNTPAKYSCRGMNHEYAIQHEIVKFSDSKEHFEACHLLLNVATVIENECGSQEASDFIQAIFHGYKR